MKNKVYSMLRETVQTCMPGSRLMLFGSRARGDEDQYSDYDLLIITPTTLTPRENLNWTSRLNRAIIGVVKIPVDLLLNSEEEIRQKHELPGHIIRTIIQEGVLL